MTGTPVAHLIVDALKKEYPRALHISELANITGIGQTSVSSSLNRRLESGHGDVERSQRGVWKYVPKHKTKSLRSVPTMSPATVAETKFDAPMVLPKSLKVVGSTSQGLLAVDPGTNESYIATRM